MSSAGKDIEQKKSVHAAKPRDGTKRDDAGASDGAKEEDDDISSGDCEECGSKLYRHELEDDEQLCDSCRRAF